MEQFALYLLKSVTWLTGFALVFLLFLRNERFFNLNRIYLLSGILVSFFLPLISIHYTVVLPAAGNIHTGSAIVTGLEEVSKNPYFNRGVIILIFYLTGVLCVSMMIIRQSRPLLKTIKEAEVTNSYSVKLIKTARYTSSFSFFSYVFVNPSITDAETEEIVNHELVHIKQWHWLDLVLVELLCILQWFNPVVWIYIRFIRQNHEYLADEVALQRTSNPAIYKAALLNQIVGYPVVSLANSFNYSLNSKRFNMMKNIINSPYRKMKILLILPVMAIILYSFAKPEYRYDQKGFQPVFKDQVASDHKNIIKGRVIRETDGKPLGGATVIVRNTTTGSSTDAKGVFKLENISEKAELVVSYVGFKSKVVKPDFTADMIIKMVRDTLKVDIDISTPQPPPPPPPPPPAEEKGSSLTPQPISSPLPSSTENLTKSFITSDGLSPLYIVDGVISNNFNKNSLDPESIESIQVYKGDSAIKKYGDKGVNGVVEIFTKGKDSHIYDGKKANLVFAGPNHDTLRTSSYGSVQFRSERKDSPSLFILDGVITEIAEINKLDPESLKYVNVLNSKDAIEKYGEKGKNGAVEITTKKNDPSIKDKIRKEVKSTVSSNIQKAEKDEFVVVEELPEFSGGGNAMASWIAQNVKYPVEALKGKITGKVFVDFIVNSNGKIKSVQVNKPVNPLLDAEAKRVISSMPDWKPGTQAGKAVDVQMQVPVEFNLQ